jgi:Predicted membrane protein (DUF2306)
MTAISATNRLTKLRWLVAVAATLLFFKVIYSILAEYRWYFPANFDESAFLTGRKETFVGLYRAAFYVHVISGPLAALLGLFLLLSGGRPKIRLWHRYAGRALVMIVLVALVPSGLVMSRQAFAGPIAGAGFAALSIATGISTAATAYFARKRNFRAHQQWAIPCFLLLASPLLLRVASGAAIVIGCESAQFYQLNAWLSWLAPLVLYEGWLKWSRAMSN